MSDPNDLSALLSEVWQHLGRGAADGRHPARYPTLATVSPAGMPEARTVALRAARRSQNRLEAHTDISTPKVASLAHHPWAQFHIWIPRADLQLRVTTRVEIVTGAEVQAQWDAVPAASRVSYGTAPVPGTPIDHVYAYDKPPVRDRFAVLSCDVHEMDVVHLGAQHRRALFRAEDDWTGQWVAP